MHLDKIRYILLLFHLNKHIPSYPNASCYLYVQIHSAAYHTSQVRICVNLLQFLISEVNSYLPVTYIHNFCFLDVNSCAIFFTSDIFKVPCLNLQLTLYHQYIKYYLCLHHLFLFIQLYHSKLMKESSQRRY